MFEEAIVLLLTGKTALNKVQGEGGAWGHGKEFEFYLRCNEKPKGSKQGSDMIKIYI